MSYDSHLQAERASSHLAGTVTAIEAICLFGSIARGDGHPGSDIDLLILGRDPKITASTLRQALPATLREDHISIAYHTPETLTQHLSRWSRFDVHLKREGEILFDRHGLMRNALDSNVSVSTYEELRLALLHLKSLDHLDRFGGRFLFPLARLYAIGRTVVFALLAERNAFEFNQERAFEQLADLVPARAADIIAISRLRPFAELAGGHDADPLPFSFVKRSCSHVATVRDAIRGLVTLSLYADDLADRPDAV